MTDVVKALFPETSLGAAVLSRLRMYVWRNLSLRDVAYPPTPLGFPVQYVDADHLVEVAAGLLAGGEGALGEWIKSQNPAMTGRDVVDLLRSVADSVRRGLDTGGASKSQSLPLPQASSSKTGSLDGIGDNSIGSLLSPAPTGGGGFWALSSVPRASEVPVGSLPPVATVVSGGNARPGGSSGAGAVSSSAVVPRVSVASVVILEDDPPSSASVKVLESTKVVERRRQREGLGFRWRGCGSCCPRVHLCCVGQHCKQCGRHWRRFGFQFEAACLQGPADSDALDCWRGRRPRSRSTSSSRSVRGCVTVWLR